jgi:hypothetical protein
LSRFRDNPNKQGERDVRPTKTQMKISGCHCPATTAKAWLRVRGYISTVRTTATTFSTRQVVVRTKNSEDGKRMHVL